MVKVRMVVLAAALLAAATALPTSFADAASSSSTKKSESAGPADAYKAGQDLVKDGKFEDARGQFEKAARLDPTNADAFNMLAYTQRRLGQLDAAFENYEKALALDPNHKGAHEYVGEAYLLVGDLAKAEEHLNKLKALCPGGCDESRMLLKSVERYKSSDKNAALDTQSW
jgi:Flp pilus assembly protein TadD